MIFFFWKWFLNRLEKYQSFNRQNKTNNRLCLNIQFPILILICNLYCPNWSRGSWEKSKRWNVYRDKGKVRYIEKYQEIWILRLFTKPEFILKISKSVLVLSLIPKNIHRPILSSLQNLEFYNIMKGAISSTLHCQTFLK